MRRLQILVATMTLLLFAGLALLVYGFASKGAELGAQLAAPSTGEGEIIVPRASSILQVAPWRDGLALHIKVHRKGEFIYFVRQNGDIVSKLAIKSEADAPAQK